MNVRSLRFFFLYSFNSETCDKGIYDQTNSFLFCPQFILFFSFFFGVPAALNYNFLYLYSGVFLAVLKNKPKEEIKNAQRKHSRLFVSVP